MTDKRKRVLIIGGVVAVVVIAVAAFGIYWFLKDDAPEEASLETAAAGLETTTTTPVSDTETSEPTETSPPVADDIAGIWAVDLSLAEFDFEETTGNFVGFRVDEELANFGAGTAVGRTPEVSGSITIEGTTLTNAEIEADMSALVTDNSFRDDKTKAALETDKFPTATFALTEPVDLGENATEGVSIVAEGKLTVHGVTQDAQFDIQAELVDGVIIVTGSTDVVFADFGVEVPTAPVVVSAEDHGPVEFQLLLRKQS